MESILANCALRNTKKHPERKNPSGCFFRGMKFNLEIRGHRFGYVNRACARSGL
jgi:hypothetical protein